MSQGTIGRLLVTALLGWAAVQSVRAAGQMSAQQLDAMDRQGYFTPNFKTAVRDLVSAREQLRQAQQEQKKFEQDLPALRNQATQVEARTEELKKELAIYDRPEEGDFVALQAQEHDPAAKPEAIVPLAQAFVWTYPASPHVPEAQQALAQATKKIADQLQTSAEAHAARQASHARLVQRARAHDLNIAEWRDFLRGMSQDDLVQMLGQPSSKSGDYWNYNDGWVVAPGGAPKQALQINFEAGRVLTVDSKVPQ